MTGVRRGEALGLQWPDLDLDAAIASFQRSLVPKGVQDPKTKAGERAIDLDDETLRTLRGWRKRQLEERPAAGTRWQEGNWVFTN